MAAEPRHGSPLDLQLPDGGRVTVSIDLDGGPGLHADLDALAQAVEVDLAAAIVIAGGQADVERAVTTVVEFHGRTATMSTHERTRQITVR